MRGSIKILRKDNIFDPEARAIQGTLEEMGFNSIESLRMGKWIEIEFKEENAFEVESQLNRMGSQLLASPILEDFITEVRI